MRKCPPVPRHAPLVLLLALAAALLGLAGCGGSSGNGLASKSPDQIVEAARTAAKHAASVRISGSTITQKEPISLNMELVADKGAKGHIAVNGLGMDVVALESAFYIRGDAAFYRRVAGPAAAQLLEGKWLKAPTTGEFAQLSQLTDFGTLIEQTLSRPLSHHGALKSAGTVTIAGQKAVGVIDTSDGGTLYVAATGTPYPLQIAEGGHRGGRITFDRWNQPVTLAAPPNPINVNQLQNGH